MHGLPSDTCPECGGPVDLETIVRMQIREGWRSRLVSLRAGWCLAVVNILLAVVGPLPLAALGLVAVALILMRNEDVYGGRVRRWSVLMLAGMAVAQVARLVGRSL
jgi:hypothetical protein